MRKMLAVLLLLTCVTATPAQAMSRDVRDVLTIGLYGAVAGTGLGLASLPLTGQGKSVFIGTSAGLYLGLIIGLYYITYRDDPNNPLRPENLPKSAQNYELPPTPMTAQRPVVALSYPVVNF